MATFGQLKTAISARLLDANGTAVSGSDVAASINEAIRYFKFREFWFNVKTDTSKTLTIGDPAISLPSDFLIEIPENGFVINYSGSRYVLCKKDQSEYDMVNTEANGLPYMYSRVSGGYKCYFYPNIAYSMVISYLKEYDDLVNDGDTNDFTVYADALIRNYALYMLHNELRQDQNMGSYYEKQTSRELENLLAQSNKYNGSGYLQIEAV